MTVLSGPLPVIVRETIASRESSGLTCSTSSRRVFFPVMSSSTSFHTMSCTGMNSLSTISPVTLTSRQPFSPLSLGFLPCMLPG